MANYWSDLLIVFIAKLYCLGGHILVFWSNLLLTKKFWVFSRFLTPVRVHMVLSHVKTFLLVLF